MPDVQYTPEEQARIDAFNKKYPTKAAPSPAPVAPPMQKQKTLADRIRGVFGPVGGAEEIKRQTGQ